MILYRFDQNRRVYKRDPLTNQTLGGAPIYSEHFIPHEVDDETATEYVCSGNFRVNKRSMKGFYVSQPRDKYPMYTEAEKEAALWSKDHAYKLSQAVFRCKDIGILKQIAALVGYKDK